MADVKKIDTGETVIAGPTTNAVVDKPVVDKPVVDNFKKTEYDDYLGRDGGPFLDHLERVTREKRSAALEHRDFDWNNLQDPDYVADQKAADEKQTKLDARSFDEVEKERQGILDAQKKADDTAAGVNNRADGSKEIFGGTSIGNTPKGK